MKKFTEEVKKISLKRAEISGQIDEEKEIFDKKNRPQIDESIYDEVLQSWKDTGDKVWARIFNATYQLTGYEAGEKLTKKRDIAMQEIPLDGLV